LAVLKVFGNIPVAVITRNDADDGFLRNLNIQLSQSHRPFTIVMARNLVEAKRKLLDRKGQGAVPATFKGMFWATEPLALERTLLKGQLSDMVPVTPQMFRHFRILAGDRISEMVTEIQGQFAMSRSA